MNMSVTVSRKMVVATLVAVLLIGGAALAFANHDPDIVHLCIKENGQLVLSEDGICKGQEAGLSLATEDALAALQSSNNNLQTQLNDLNALMKRLHGYNAAVIERYGLSGTTSNEISGLRIFLTFCDGDLTECETGDPGSFTLQTDLLTQADRGTFITFDESNTADFAAIAALLTNGVNDGVAIGREFYDQDGNFKGGGSTVGTERNFFYRKLQVSTGPGYVDLAEIPLSNITIAVDSIVIFFDSTSGETSYSLDYRVFFGID